MKIVSLQSVGLGDIGLGINERVFAKPIRYEVGERVAKLGYLMSGNEPKVTEINYQQGDFDAYGFEIYTVHTSDGHIRVLPADKYIAEWSDDTDRISPDDIGNDIHEFLHGGDK